jgi:O-methyltransferase involved in polyketide biosynthesis
VPGSQLVLDFVVSDAVLTRSEREAVEKITAFVKTRGEPWLSRFSPDELETLLRDVGFGEVDYFSRERATATYLKDRTDGLSLDPAIQLMSAVV